jgi:hypothetical protein
VAKRAAPESVIRNLIAGYWVSRLIYVAAKLGIADLLKQKPQTVEALAAATQVQPTALYRILRTLASYGIFAEVAGKRFKLTPLGKTLRTGVPGSMRAFALMLVEKHVWYSWEQLLYAAQTGELPFDHLYGTPFYKYLEQRPDDLKIFGDAMTSLSSIENPAIARVFGKSYAPTGAGTVVDVGGGHGSLLATILAEHRKLKGVLFDAPPVIERARQEPHITAKSIADRCALVPGDFFVSVPAGGDLYILKYILHNWDDERCVAILSNIRTAMGRKARVLVADPVISPGNGQEWAKLLDIQMMVSVKGAERTKAEFAVLFKKAGLKLKRVTPTPSPLSVVEAVRA